MIDLTGKQPYLRGEGGEIPVRKDDEVVRKLALLFEGECEVGNTIDEVCRKFGYSRQWYYRLLERFKREGSEALKSAKTGPKRNYRRAGEAERQVIRYRCLDPDMSAGVIAQRLQQSGVTISMRSVERIIAEYGLQKKTPLGRAENTSGGTSDASDQTRAAQ